MIRFIKDIFFYLFRSRNRRYYAEISKVTKLKSFRIYRIAHGKVAKTQAEIKALEELKQRGIVSEIRIKYMYG